MTDFGVLMFPTDYAVQPVELARAAEARGFESLFFPEHTHIPASRKSPWPGGPELPQEYWHSHDPYVALGAAAAVTETLRLGTGITLVTERDPIVMAKQVASLDHISGGRVLLGVGAGWNAEEMENHGTVFADRWKILRERILAMREIWREEEAEFHGQFVNFDAVWSYPKPAQDGGPKVLMGASSRYTWKRVAEYCDGWFPIHQDANRASASGALDYVASIAAVRRAWAEAGRDGEPDFSIFGVGPDAQRVAELIDMGFNRIIFALPSADADTVMPLMDRYAEIGHGVNS
ncbi:MAG: LLM class F420-dependent oxidoreductase [Pseudomonadales bacterium]|jgi:probable F420-dependent oxidoreductase|nr:LLM class F420-dependent oxidoreductase [Pseudomonadales bacterium]MDP6471113.1 LLM class F420-dependent oxidoreductase [Pseudomonadales bacterium]MDP6825701.1 LLM class F420-dependent oxidoreductase [Pseudomonadales bacterium]MDP6973157.1 LLM class F420-dependent oxidoreductase [Pseudomonadales bacterium]|tara:strand:+ start:3783 stop:4655 length:873 start_codon:yes stop_codon:yes gene_type:complete